MAIAPVLSPDSSPLKAKNKWITLDYTKGSGQCLNGDRVSLHGTVAQRLGLQFDEQSPRVVSPIRLLTLCVY